MARKKADQQARKCWHEEIGWVLDQSIMVFGRCIRCWQYIRPPEREVKDEHNGSVPAVDLPKSL